MAKNRFKVLRTWCPAELEWTGEEAVDMAQYILKNGKDAKLFVMEAPAGHAMILYRGPDVKLDKDAKELAAAVVDRMKGR